MNRPIKFRAWTGATMEYKVMAGYLGAFYVAGMNEKDSACLSDANTIYNEATPVMQWTGLKDKNGKEIYEGDVLSFSGDSGYYKVFFDYYTDQDGNLHTGFYSHSNFKENDLYSGQKKYGGDFRDSQIVGNVHQNPELLSV